jgi:hypothetical protein
MTLPTTAIPTNEDNKNKTMEDIALFWGDDKHNDEDPHDFLNRRCCGTMVGRTSTN